MQLMRQDVALSAARGWAGIEPPLRAKYALMRGLSNPLILQASAPFHSVSSFRRKEIFFYPLVKKCEIASCFVA